jgi:hypothetical protein
MTEEFFRRSKTKEFKMKTYSKRTLFLPVLVFVLGLVPAGRAIITGNPVQIAGNVRDNSGNPVTIVEVAVDDYVGDIFPTKTDAQGNYSVDIKEEGNYRVTVNCAQLTALGYACVNPGAVTITSGSAQLDFTVIPAAPPLLITNTFLPEGSIGVAYKFQLGAKGGRPPYQWQFAVDSTNQPAGLVLNSRGLLSGTLMTNGVSTIKVQVTDSNASVTNKVLSITMNPGPVPDTSASPSPPN